MNPSLSPSGTRRKLPKVNKGTDDKIVGATQASHAAQLDQGTAGDPVVGKASDSLPAYLTEIVIPG
jgi:hypothetical protein